MWPGGRSEFYSAGAILRGQLIFGIRSNRDGRTSYLLKGHLKWQARVLRRDSEAFSEDAAREGQMCSGRSQFN